MSTHYFPNTKYFHMGNLAGYLLLFPFYMQKPRHKDKLPQTPTLSSSLGCEITSDCKAHTTAQWTVQNC